MSASGQPSESAKCSPVNHPVYPRIAPVATRPGYRLYGPRFRNSSGFHVQNCETAV